MQDGTATAAQPPPAGVDLNITEHNVELRLVTGENDAGEEQVQSFHHRFRAQDRGDVINLYSACASEKSVKAGGNARQKSTYGNRDAMHRYWRKYHDGVKGYPGADDWRVVPEEARADWHASHQVLAVNELMRCEGKVVGSEMTFDGGTWQVAVGVPDLFNPAVKLVFSVNEWGEKQSSVIGKAIERYSDANGGAETGINVALYIQTFLDLTRRVDGTKDAPVHIDGKSWDEYVTDEASRVRFLKTIYPIWVYKAAETLFNRWESTKRE